MYEYKASGRFMKMLLCVTLLFVSCCQSDAHPQPKKQNIEVVEEACVECGGDGVVVYESDDLIVKSGAGSAGQYSCPMCGGTGKLYSEVQTTYNGRGKRPLTMPPKKADGREFDGGPDFGHGSWAHLDEDGVWRRYGG